MEARVNLVLPFPVSLTTTSEPRVSNLELVFPLY